MITPTRPTPLINALSGTVLSPGDTLLIEGAEFSETLAQNVVRFNNSVGTATPFLATTDTLMVVVPEWANTGALQVITEGVSSAGVIVEILRGVGDVWVVGNAPLKLPDAGNEEYMLIPFSASTNGAANYLYSVTPEFAAAYPSRQPGPAQQSHGTVDLQTTFEIDIREQAFRFMEDGPRKKRPLEPSRTTAAAPDTTTFLVLRCVSCSTSSAANFITVTAALQFEGTHGLIYADVNQPTGAYNASDYQTFGMQFDSQIFPTDTTYFGPTTDIDGNGKVIILFTPVVNDLTPDGTAQTEGFISGFFLLNDLAQNFYPTTSNAGEIFYAMVPDPNNEYGNAFTKPQVESVTPGTLAHEFEHMISFGYRFVTLGQSGVGGLSLTQLTWLEEGMAHMAEDLNNFTSNNQTRSDLYLFDPGEISLMGGDTLEQRGGIFLFLRYLSDQYGEGILRGMVRSSCKGIPCIENATGIDFFTSVADYLATLFLDGSGVNLDPRYQYTSNLNLNALANALKATDVAVGAFGGSVRAASGDYWGITGIQNPATNFVVGGSTIRVIVFRTN